MLVEGVRELSELCEEANRTTARCRPGAGVFFEVVLTNPPAPAALVRVVFLGSGGGTAFMRGLGLKVDESVQVVHFWTADTMRERVRRMRDHEGRRPESAQLPNNDLLDPWQEPPPESMVRMVTDLTDALMRSLKVTEQLRTRVLDMQRRQLCHNILRQAMRAWAAVAAEGSSAPISGVAARTVPSAPTVPTVRGMPAPAGAAQKRSGSAQMTKLQLQSNKAVYGSGHSLAQTPRRTGTSPARPLSASRRAAAGTAGSAASKGAVVSSASMTPRGTRGSASTEQTPPPSVRQHSPPSARREILDERDVSPGPITAAGRDRMYGESPAPATVSGPWGASERAQLERFRQQLRSAQQSCMEMLSSDVDVAAMAGEVDELRQHRREFRDLRDLIEGALAGDPSGSASASGGLLSRQASGATASRGNSGPLTPLVSSGASLPVSARPVVSAMQRPGTSASATAPWTAPPVRASGMGVVPPPESATWWSPSPSTARELRSSETS